MLHNLYIPSPLIKVMVEMVYYSDVQVLVTTLEVVNVAQALQNFISCSYG